MNGNFSFHVIDFTNLIVIQIRQLIPFWFAGTVAGSVISVYGTNIIKRLAGSMHSGKGGVYNFVQSIAATLLGIASPVCMYGTIPVIAALHKAHVPDYLLVNFMVSSILLNPNLLFMSFALGYPLAIARFVTVVFAGLFAGLAVWRFRPIFFDFSDFEIPDSGTDCVTARKNLSCDLLKSIRITAPYFALGIVLTALIDKFMPEAVFDFMFRENRALSVLFMASAGVPVYLCGGGTIPLLRDWLSEGMTNGSAVAFMLSGPATKLTNVSAVKAILGIKNFIIYIVFMLIFSVTMGYLTDFLL